MLATVVAVIYRKSGTQLPGTAQELTRRKLREKYRALALTDPTLARNIRVGRPDLTRDYSDGGLLDLNSLSAEGLNTFGLFRR